MPTRTYELMVISRGNLNEDAVQASTDKIVGSIQSLGGEVTKVDQWGKRQFAYEIDHMNEGWYTVYDLELEGAQLGELERQLRLADEVVRHKTVRPGVRVKHTS